MALHEKHSIRELLEDDVYASVDLSVSMPKYKFPQAECDPRHAYSVVHDELMLDGNCRLSEEQAMPIAQALDRLGFAWFEEPIKRDNIDGYARLAAAVEMPITGGETFKTLEQFKPYLDQKAYAIVQPDVGFCGPQLASGSYWSSDSSTLARSGIPSWEKYVNFTLALVMTARNEWRWVPQWNFTHGGRPLFSSSW
mgnify:CR=1 FL=1